VNIWFSQYPWQAQKKNQTKKEALLGKKTGRDRKRKKKQMHFFFFRINMMLNFYTKIYPRTRLFSTRSILLFSCDSLPRQKKRRTKLNRYKRKTNEAQARKLNGKRHTHINDIIIEKKK
jgi:hypothetical protein